ncbi:MAG: hypothetical protein OEM26_07650 [Saprospiraceae bacterium]|nr:hypothetical protein [Saprospiraceae bacterium]
MVIRSDINKNTSTPIIALTAMAVQQELARAMDVGMQGYVTKLFTPKKLNEVLHRYLNLKIL